MLQVHQSNAQNLPEQDCSGAISVCQPIYQQANSYVGEGNQSELDAANEGCLSSGENNTVWYIINITSPGTLVFTITPNNANDDYDFAVWNATGQGCNAVATNLPDRCNYASNFASSPGGLTGLSTTAAAPSYGAGGPSFSSSINALVGETYILVVDNFSSSQFGYTLDFSASTASIYDTVKPRFATAGSHCGIVSNTLTVSMSEPVKCNSIDADGSNFYITPNIPGVSAVVAATSTNCVSGQFTNSYDIQFAGVLPPGSYTLHARSGNDGNSLIDNCGNEQAYTDSITFTMNAGNPPQMVVLDTPACIRARVILDRGVTCNSVALNGSDFYITGPSPVNVISATPVNCDANNMTDTIDLNFDRSIITPGTYTLNVTNGSDGNTLLDTCDAAVNNSISWTVSDKGIDAVVSPDLLCEAGYVQLSATPAVQPSPNGYELLWSPGTYIQDSTAANTIAYVAQTTTFNVQILDENFCYRRDRQSVTVSVRNPQLENITDASLCIGEQVQFNAGGGASYAWYPADGLSCTACPDPVASPLQTTQYAVVISDQYGCSDTLFQELIVNPLPVINAGTDTAIYYGDVALLHAGIPTGKYYTWLPTTGINYPNTPNPTASPQETTMYTVTVIDTNECRNTDSVLVQIRTDIPVFIPSGFTPNGDGRNDVFRLSNVKFHKLQEFRVYNRWGQEVFSTTDPRSGWDGTYKGEPQESGVYNYLIRVSYPDGRVQTFKGDVTLVR